MSETRFATLGRAHDTLYRPRSATRSRKWCLFQAFDERATPELMKQDVRVRAADVSAINETLGL